MSVSAAKSTKIETPVVIPQAKQKELDEGLAGLLDDFIRIHKLKIHDKDLVLNIAKDTARSIWQARQSLQQDQDLNASIKRSYDARLNSKTGFQSRSQAKSDFFQKIDSFVRSLRPGETEDLQEVSFEPTPIIGETSSQEESSTVTAKDVEEVNSSTDATTSEPVPADLISTALMPILESFRQGEEMSVRQLEKFAEFMNSDTTASAEGATLTAETFNGAIADNKFDSEKFAEIFNGLDADTQNAIKGHFNKVMLPKLETNPGELAVQALSNSELEGFKQGLISVFKSLPERSNGATPTGYEKLAMNRKIAEAYARSIEAIKGSVFDNMTATKKAEITKRILLDNLGNIEGLTRDDLIASLQHMQSRLDDKSTKEDRNKEHAGFMAAIGDKAPYLLFALPFLAGPLSHVFRYIPIIGSTLNQILGQLSQTGGSMLMGLIASKLNFGGGASKQAPPERQAPPTRAEASQPAKTTVVP